MKKSIIKKSEKYITEPVFEKHMASIALSFAQMDERFDRHEKVFDGIFNILNELKESNRGIRSDIKNFMQITSVHDRKIDDITERVENLENRHTKFA